jgi:hypothetical protein
MRGGEILPLIAVTADRRFNLMPTPKTYNDQELTDASNDIIRTLLGCHSDLNTTDLMALTHYASAFFLYQMFPIDSPEAKTVMRSAGLAVEFLKSPANSEEEIATVPVSPQSSEA